MEQDFLSRLETSFDDLSKRQKQLAEYILANSGAAHMTATALAAEVDISESTVVRFAMALGYEGYPEMQRAFKESLRVRMTTVERIEDAKSPALKPNLSMVDRDEMLDLLDELRAAVPASAKIMAVVKADAYGHGDKFIADELIKLGVNWFAVSNINEAMSLRTQGIFHPILVLGMTPAGKAKQLCEFNILSILTK